MLGRFTDVAGWPNWLRWIALLPAASIGSAVALLLYSIINAVFNIGSGMSDLFSIIAGGIGAGVFVFISVWFAPRYHLTVALCAGGIIGAFLLFYFGELMAGRATGGPWPVWQQWLAGVAVLIGSVIGVASTEPHKSPPPLDGVFMQWLPVPLRWILALPIALAVGVLPIFIWAAILYTFRREGSFFLNRLEMSVLFPAIFLAVGTAIVPNLKRAVAGILTLLLVGYITLSILAWFRFGAAASEPPWAGFAYWGLSIYSIVVTLLGIWRASISPIEATHENAAYSKR